MVTKECNEKILSEFNQLFKAIDDYAREFSIGSMLAKAVLNEDLDQNICGALSDLDSTYGDTLDMIGLGLKSCADTSTSLRDLSRLKIDVIDEACFLSFLETLKPEQIEEGTLKLNLDRIPMVLVPKIQFTYCLNKPTEETIQLYEAVKDIIKQYKRLGMASSIRELECYLNHAIHGDLTEYERIEAEDLLSEPGHSFGPGDWQRDSTPEDLEWLWYRALEFLDETKANPRAQELYQQLARHLLKCVEIAIKYMESDECDTPEQIEMSEQKKEYLDYVRGTLIRNVPEGLLRLS
jgi:hypothetical protein